MSTLLVGFDSAWTATNSGALVGLVMSADGSRRELGPPITADFCVAERTIRRWQNEQGPTSTIVLIDQPTIVANATGQRPVEHIISSIVCRRHGAMQPANTAMETMFGIDAPIWSFLSQFGGVADPLTSSVGTRVFETYPVLVLIAFGWTLLGSRTTGRLPKYNPERKKTFSIADWQYVCTQTMEALAGNGLPRLSRWLDPIARNQSPCKRDQDYLDACLCLLVAVHLAEGKGTLMVGDQISGYILAPDNRLLQQELEVRCRRTNRAPSEWVRLCRPGVVRT